MMFLSTGVSMPRASPRTCRALLLVSLVALAACGGGPTDGDGDGDADGGRGVAGDGGDGGGAGGGDGGGRDGGGGDGGGGGDDGGVAAPSVPTNLVARATSSQGVELSWMPPSGAFTGFEVERSVASGGPFALIASPPASALGYGDMGLATGSTYFYRVRAVNGASASAFTSVVGVSTAAAVPPNAPTGLTGVQEVVASAGVARLSWTDAATDETAYEVQYSSEFITWGSTVTLPAGSTGWVHESPVFGTNNYRVRAVGVAGASAWVQVSVYNGPIVIGTLCPSTEGTSASALSQTSLRLGWTWNICGGVAIERAPSATGPWAEVARLGNFVFGGPPNGTWDDTGLVPGTLYHYRFRTLPLFAPTPSGPPWSPSGYTAPVSATTVPPVVIATPTGLTATVTSATSVSLAWTDVAQDETGYSVEYATGAAGPFTEAFRLGANMTMTSVSGLTPATAYWMRVRAVKGTTSSAPSNAVSFTTATRAVLRTTGDATVMESTALLANQNVTLPSGPNDVGCFFTWTIGPGGQALFHNCGGSALRFDTAALSGRNVLVAALVMYPCALAPHPVSDARYLVRALAGSWSPSTVTFNTLPQVYTAGSWWLPAPTAGGAQAWDVTTVVKNWASGTWPSNGLYVGQSPITDRVPNWGGQNWDNQNQVTSYCSLEQTGGSIDYVPALHVDYR
ncbi:DNRLRE domain-containing protein [Corallococcus sp. CA053C]|nr:DNRLRE domain-containing protein [Corallococcus sp. CA053C]